MREGRERGREYFFGFQLWLFGRFSFRNSEIPVIRARHTIPVQPNAFLWYYLGRRSAGTTSIPAVGSSLSGGSTTRPNSGTVYSGLSRSGGGFESSYKSAKKTSTYSSGKVTESRSGGKTTTSKGTGLTGNNSGGKGGSSSNNKGGGSGSKGGFGGGSKSGGGTSGG